MFRSMCLALLGALAAAACSTADKAPADESPRNLTSVIELRTVNHGINGHQPFESTSRIQTRAAMQRVDTRVKGTGTVTRFVVGGQDESTIARLDRKLIWALDHKEKTYSECPLKGCTGAKAKPRDKAADPKNGDKPAAPDCRVKIVQSALTVKRTGDRRVINGFDTDEFRVAWVVRLQDAKKRQSESLLGVNVWAAQSTPALKEATAMEVAYDKAFAAAAGDAKKPSVVPDEAAKLIDGHLAQFLATEDRKSFMKAGKELGKLKGHPILTELEWHMKGEACTTEQSAAGEKAQPPSDDGNLLSSVTDFFTGRKSGQAGAAPEDKPILAFTVEVKSHQVEPVHDSAFLPPGSYQQAR